MRNKIVIVFIFLCLSIAAADKAYSVYLKEEAPQDLEGKTLNNKKQWTKILKDMPAEQIEEILGKPERIVEGVTTVWFYQKGGSVELSNGKAIKWTKPYSWDY